MSNSSGASQTGAARHQEHRHCIRRKMAEPVAVSLGPMESGRLLDISAKGASLLGPKPLKPGLRLSLRFQLPDSNLFIQPTYEVVWALPDGRVGLKFLYMAEREQRQLQEWLALHLPPQAAEPAVAKEAPAAEDYSAEEAYARSLLDLEAEVGALRVDQALALIADEAKSLTHADGVAIALRSGQGIVCRASVGIAPEVGAELDPNAGISAECLRTGRIIRCEDAVTDPRIDPSIARELNLRTIFIVPVMVENAPAGLVEALSSRPRAFDSPQLECLEGVATIVGTVVTRAEAPPSAADTSSEAAAPSPRSESSANVLEFLEADLRAANKPGPRAAEALPPAPSSPLARALKTVEPELLHPEPILAAQSVPADVPAPAQYAAPTFGIKPEPARTVSIRLNLEHPVRTAILALLLLATLVAAGGYWAGRAGLIRRLLGISTPVAQQPGSAEPVRVAPHLMLAHVVSNPSPEYPATVPQGKIMAPVFLEVVIGTDGTVKRATYVSGEPTLKDAAIATVRHWTYQPYAVDGRPVEVVTSVGVSFVHSQK